jgi:hypothetical protein
MAELVAPWVYSLPGVNGLSSSESTEAPGGPTTTSDLVDGEQSKRHQIGHQFYRDAHSLPAGVLSCPFRGVKGAREICRGKIGMEAVFNHLLQNVNELDQLVVSTTPREEGIVVVLKHITSHDERSDPCEDHLCPHLVVSVASQLVGVAAWPRFSG